MGLLLARRRSRSITADAARGTAGVAIELAAAAACVPRAHGPVFHPGGPESLHCRRNNPRGDYPYRVQVEILHVGYDFKNMNARSKRNALLADPLEGAPAAGVGHEDAAGDVDAIDFDVEGTVGEPAAGADFDVVLGAGGHVDGVGEPLSGLEVVHDIAAARRVGGQDDVHVLTEPVLAPGIARNVVVVGDAFAAEIEVLRLKGSGNRDRHSGIRTGSGHGTDPNRVQVEVLLVRNDLQDMLAGGERHACLADPLEGAPAAGVGHGNAAGDVDAIDFDVEGTVGEPAAGADFDVVLGAGGHIDGVGEPLSGLEVVHDIAAARRVGGQDDVHVLTEPVLAPGIARNVVVVGDAFAAEIEVLRLKGSGNCDRHSGIRTGSGHGTDPNRVQVEVLPVRNDLQDMLAGGERHACLADPLEGAPAAGVGHEDAAGDVDAIDFDVEARGRGPVAIACPTLDVVWGAGGHVDGVGEPLPGLEVVHDVAAAGGVGGHDDVHVLAEPVLAPGIARNVVVRS